MLKSPPPWLRPFQPYSLIEVQYDGSRLLGQELVLEIGTVREEEHK